MSDTIVIESTQQIIDRLSSDGDMREAHEFDSIPYIVRSGDDLGFYQQACEFLLTQISQGGGHENNKA